MKKILLLLLVATFATIVNAQDPKTVFTAEKIVFYGLDFTKAKFAIPDAKPAEIKDTYFEAWNETVFGDNGRFPKESAFGKVTVYGDPTVVKRRNAAVNTADITGKYEKPLTREDLQGVINDYKDGVRKEGLGVVFIVEHFSKAKKEGIASIVFFDIASRKVLLAKRMSGEPGGGGLNNYWMRTIQVMFEKMGATEYYLWQKEVMGK
ncbi:MAG TPA: hypothetical protein VK174_14840 [Chitinophagales bacterium]|nr:hypothetical protein [Chitinophagales bacterium]